MREVRRSAVNTEQARGRVKASISISSNFEKRGKNEEEGSDEGTKLRDGGAEEALAERDQTQNGDTGPHRTEVS